MANEMIHSKACQANALKSALENLRDEEGQTAHGFRVAVQDGALMRMADEYLDDDGGFQADVCQCYVKHINYLRKVWLTDGVAVAQQLAAKYLAEGKITTFSYIELVRWTEGRF